ncbi:heavy-metal-associated domain-containing protein [Chelatococcus sp. SYSU_G07232]|uniref:Heavy-metal-associated domain-containing protein n=1 Tax=Chelatococcus albus TaxID=3047466 RepID=A0ABT7AKZ8_9HYPH|nr:heavy-metal-associated domain-containing protein [Chelatococcus sp. SYSU_G07232]MDJ1160050.1 heavy-metal-associated domain-containing protein [Chelatococcus sp. SYSU_G07232]
MPVTFEVEGMTCQGCVNSVTRAVERVAPGARVSVDLAARTVTVDAAKDEATLAKAITDAGYDVLRSR